MAMIHTSTGSLVCLYYVHVIETTCIAWGDNAYILVILNDKLDNNGKKQNVSVQDS